MKNQHPLVFLRNLAQKRPDILSKPSTRADLEPSVPLPTRSTTPPVNPTPGEIWLEVDESDRPVEEWYWQEPTWYTARIYTATIPNVFENDLESQIQIDVPDGIYDGVFVDSVTHGLKITNRDVSNNRTSSIYFVYYRSGSSGRVITSTGACSLYREADIDKYFAIQKEVKQNIMNGSRAKKACFGFYFQSTTPPGTVYGSSFFKYRKTRTVIN